jgi:hypothetical protein
MSEANLVRKKTVRRSLVSAAFLVGFAAVLLVLPSVTASSGKYYVAQRQASAVDSFVFHGPESQQQSPMLPSSKYAVSVNLNQVTLVLDPMDAAAIRGGSPEQIGISRKLGILSISYGRRVTNPDGTRIRIFALRSPGAVGIRLHLESFDLPDGDQVFLHGMEEDYIAGPYSGKGPWGNGEFWTGTVAGDTVVIEYYIKGVERPLRVSELSHIYRNPFSAQITPEALSCEVDASCSNEPEKNAIGRFDFISGSATMVCAGTLINDPSSDRAPFFLTANHCIATEDQARSMEIFWFYQTTACNSGVLRSDIARSAGADLLARDVFSDSSLVKVSEPVPSGVVFAGWDPNLRSPGTPGFGLHHPDVFIPPSTQSFLRKSSGPITDVNTACSALGVQNGYLVTWDSGLTEAGSSGSPFFVTDNGQNRLVGVLACGTVNPACGQSNVTLYGRFADFFPMIQSILAQGGGGPQTIQLTSGTAQTGSTGAAASAGSCLVGQTQYTIAVPNNGSQLTITLAGNQSDEMFVRFGQPVAVSGGSITADFSAQAQGGNQSVTISGSSSPALAPGTYFIAVGNCAAAQLSFTLTATVNTNIQFARPAITSLTADLNGDTLTLTGTATDSDGDITMAQVFLLDGSGNVVNTVGPFSHDFGTAATVSFAVNIRGLGSVPSALQARLTLIDALGASSNPFTADFSQGDAGGPVINKGGFDSINEIMTLKGGTFEVVRVEINGLIVSPPAPAKVKGGGAKLRVFGTGGELNLRSGINRVRVISDGLRSNLFLLSN